METKSADENKLISYVLGETSEAETEQFDELSVTDDDFAARLSAVEHELVDAYAREELSGPLRDRFINHYLTSTRRRANVESAKTFLSYVDKAGANATLSSSIDNPAERRSWLKSFFRVPSLRWGFAAASVLAVIAIVLVFENLRLKDQLKELALQSESIHSRELALEEELAARQSASANTERELADARERLGRHENEPGPTAPKENSTVPLVAFNLLPPLRGAAKLPEFRIPNASGLITLNVVTEATEFSAYRVELKESSSGRTVWHSGKLKLDAKGSTVRLNLRSDLFSAQNYAAELIGVRPNGSAEKIGTYAFKVLR